jgi:hypothetical protein
MVSTRGNNIFHFPIESYVKTLSSRCGPIGQLRQLVFREQYKEQSYQGTIPWSEGDVCLWQVGLGSNFNKPIMVRVIASDAPIIRIIN